MVEKCPLCQQPLPKGVSTRQLQARMEQLAAPMLAEERRQLKQELGQEYRARLKQREEAARRQAYQKAKTSVKGELTKLAKEAAAARHQVQQAARQHRKDLQQAQKQVETKAEARLTRELAKAERQADCREKRAARLAAREAEARAAKLEAKRERERARHEADRARMERQINQLSREVEKARSEQLGEEAEADLYEKLRSEFPTDRIERIKKGVRGADIVQHVMVGTREVGRLVYESKNVITWQNAFVTKAKQYQRRYDTPYVLVVTRVLPKKQRGICTVRNIPVVEPRLAVPLAAIVRDAIVELGELRLSQKGRNTKAQNLFDYIIGSEFRGQFKAMSESVADLREQQQKECNWHENEWEKRTKLHDRIDSGRRKVSAKIKAITGTSAKAPKLKVLRPSA